MDGKRFVIILAPPGGRREYWDGAKWGPRESALVFEDRKLAAHLLVQLGLRWAKAVALPDQAARVALAAAPVVHLPEASETQEPVDSRRGRSRLYRPKSEQYFADEAKPRPAEARGIAPTDNTLVAVSSPDGWSVFRAADYNLFLQPEEHAPFQPWQEPAFSQFPRFRSFIRTAKNRQWGEVPAPPLGQEVVLLVAPGVQVIRGPDSPKVAELRGRLEADGQFLLTTFETFGQALTLQAGDAVLLLHACPQVQVRSIHFQHGTSALIPLQDALEFVVEGARQNWTWTLDKVDAFARRESVATGSCAPAETAHFDFHSHAPGPYQLAFSHDSGVFAEVPLFWDPRIRSVAYDNGPILPGPEGHTPARLTVQYRDGSERPHIQDLGDPETFKVDFVDEAIPSSASMPRWDMNPQKATWLCKSVHANQPQSTPLVLDWHKWPDEEYINIRIPRSFDQERGQFHFSNGHQRQANKFWETRFIKKSDFGGAIRVGITAELAVEFEFQGERARIATIRFPTTQAKDGTAVPQAGRIIGWSVDRDTPGTVGREVVALEQADLEPVSRTTIAIHYDPALPFKGKLRVAGVWRERSLFGKEKGRVFRVRANSLQPSRYAEPVNGRATYELEAFGEKCALATVPFTRQHRNPELKGIAGLRYANDFFRLGPLDQIPMHEVCHVATRGGRSANNFDKALGRMFEEVAETARLYALPDPSCRKHWTEAQIRQVLAVVFLLFHDYYLVGRDLLRAKEFAKWIEFADRHRDDLDVLTAQITVRYQEYIDDLEETKDAR